MLANLKSFVEFHTNYFENVLYTISHRIRKNKNKKNIINVITVNTNNNNLVKHQNHNIPGIYFNPPSDILKTSKIINEREAKYKVSL